VVRGDRLPEALLATPLEFGHFVARRPKTKQPSAAFAALRRARTWPIAAT
jgi:hypothetical protein